jgi:polysaccharide export outer membrane protein
MRRMILFGTMAVICYSIMAPLTYSQTEERRLPKPEGQITVAADSDTYIVGPEDVLYISVWKEEALSKTVTVRIDGKISLPLIDEIQAAGQTPLRLKEILTERFQEFIDAPNVSVMVMEANSYKVYISGQVKTPGVIRLRSETSLAQVISMAGGVTDLANEKKIMVVRMENGQQKIMTVIYKPNRPGVDSQLEQLRKLLVELEAKYTQKHPDIKTTKRMIANLEQKSKLGSGEANSDRQDLGASLILKAGDTIIVLDVMPHVDHRPKNFQDQER